MDILTIAGRAARNIQRRYSLEWQPCDLEDAAGWGALGIIEANARIEQARDPQRYAYGVAQREIITRMLRGRQFTLPITMDMPAVERNDERDLSFIATLPLTAQERDVLLARLDGLTRGQIAARLDLDFWDVHRILQRCRKRLARLVAA